MFIWCTQMTLGHCLIVVYSNKARVIGDEVGSYESLFYISGAAYILSQNYIRTCL